MKKKPDSLTCKRFARGALCAIAILGLSAALDGMGLSFFAAQVAQAEPEMSDLEQKAHWQAQYRTLLQLQVRLRGNAATSRENYARARRRNYPRGGARQQFLIDEREAIDELAKVQTETEELLEQARRASVPRNWFYEVDDEGTQSTAPAATATTPADEDDGRNPLYK
jgi:hypothetical protein